MGQVEQGLNSLVKFVLVASLGLAMPGSLLFCYRYARYSPWYTTQVGQNMLAVMALLTLLEGLPLLALIGHDRWKWVFICYLVVYPMLPVVTWWRTILLILTQVEARRRERQGAQR